MHRNLVLHGGHIACNIPGSPHHHGDSDREFKIRKGRSAGLVVYQRWHATIIRHGRVKFGSHGFVKTDTGWRIPLLVGDCRRNGREYRVNNGDIEVARCRIAAHVRHRPHHGMHAHREDCACNGGGRTRCPVQGIRNSQASGAVIGQACGVEFSTAHGVCAQACLDVPGNVSIANERWRLVVGYRDGKRGGGCIIAAGIGEGPQYGIGMIGIFVQRLPGQGTTGR